MAKNRTFTPQRDARGRFVPCIHHWMLPEPDGPTSIGTCLKCGATQEALNSMPRRSGWQLRPRQERKDTIHLWPKKEKD